MNLFVCYFSYKNVAVCNSHIFCSYVLVVKHYINIKKILFVSVLF